MTMAMIFAIMISFLIGLTGDAHFCVLYIFIIFKFWKEYDKIEDKVLFLEFIINSRSNKNE